MEVLERGVNGELGFHSLLNCTVLPPHLLAVTLCARPSGHMPPSYTQLDYGKSRYDYESHSVDAKIVVMGNTGASRTGIVFCLHKLLTPNTQVLGRLACYNGTLKTNLTLRIPHRLLERSS